MYQLVPHVQTRVDIWIDPFADPAVTGYQIIQALYAFARGGLVGTGLGGGIPTTIPAVETDFPFAALGEELGLVGIMAILGLYLVVDRARPAHRRRRPATNSGHCSRPAWPSSSASRRSSSRRAISSSSR